MSSKPAVLGIGPIFQVAEWEKLSEFAELKRYPTGTRDEFMEKVQDGEFGNIFAVYRSVPSTEITGVFDEAVLSKFPASLKFICQAGAGYDNVDIAISTGRGIQISTTPHANDNAVADLAIFLLIGALRRLHYIYTHMRSGEWRGPHPQWGHDPEGRLMGIVGMGSIGRAIARRAKPLGMRIQYHNRHELPENETEGAVYVELDELLATSDVITLGLAYSPKTHHILGAPEFAKMKKGVTIVNIARGGLIDEKALMEALDNGTVWSAGLDVFEQEPTTNAALLKDDRVFLTPHIGAGTMDTYARLEALAFDNLKQVLTGGALLTPVPEQAGKF